jgi:FK506-binding protein 1
MGIKIETLVLGDGQNMPRRGNTVIVHYTGKLEDGTRFDSSRDRNEPFEFILGAGQVILGWEEGVALMSRGQLCRLHCTPDYAYGAEGFPPSIPGNTSLIFEVELLDFK